jgi:hypothetical protein
MTITQAAVSRDHSARLVTLRGRSASNGSGSPGCGVAFGSGRDVSRQPRISRTLATMVLVVVCETSARGDRASSKAHLN